MPRLRSATLTKLGSTKAIKYIVFFFDRTITYVGEILATSGGFLMTATRLKRQNGTLEILTEMRIELEF